MFQISGKSTDSSTSGDLRFRLIARIQSEPERVWAGRPAMRVVRALHWLQDVLGQDEERRRTVFRPYRSGCKSSSET